MKKISILVIVAVLIFLMGFALGGYRGTKSQTVRSLSEELVWQTLIHSAISGQDEKASKKLVTLGFNTRIHLLREIETGVHNRDFWLNSFSLANGMLDEKAVQSLIKSSAEYSIKKVPGITKENLDYLKSK